MTPEQLEMFRRITGTEPGDPKISTLVEMYRRRRLDGETGSDGMRSEFADTLCDEFDPQVVEDFKRDIAAWVREHNPDRKEE